MVNLFIVVFLPHQLLRAVCNPALVVQLALLELCKVVICYDTEVDDVLTEVIVVALDLATERHDCQSSISVATFELLDHIVRTALELPVLRTLALTVPIVGTIVFLILCAD